MCFCGFGMTSFAKLRSFEVLSISLLRYFSRTWLAFMECLCLQWCQKLSPKLIRESQVSLKIPTKLAQHKARKHLLQLLRWGLRLITNAAKRALWHFMVSESTCVAGLCGAISSQVGFHLPDPAILAHAWFLDHVVLLYIILCNTFLSSLWNHPPDGL